MKCVLVINKELQQGLIANAAAVLAMSIGKFLPELVGHDLEDKSRNRHLGITATPLPILAHSRNHIKEMRNKLFEQEYTDCTVFDFSDIAQKCTDYTDYARKIAAIDSEDLHYLGIAIYGPKKKVNKLTGSLPLLR